MPATPHRTNKATLETWLRSAIEYWALVGGLVLVGLVLLNTYGLIAGEVFNAPLPGAFELVEMGVAVAAFAFLPYCQLTGANVTADIFTTSAGPRTIAVLNLLAALIALVIGLLLLWRMAVGLNDYREYEELTAIMGIPVWYAFVPIIVSLSLLCAAAVMSTRTAFLAAAKPGPPE